MTDNGVMKSDGIRNVSFKVGFFSIGLDTYWGQFKGLKENLQGYHAQIRKENDGRLDACGGNGR